MVSHSRVGGDADVSEKSCASVMGGANGEADGSRSYVRKLPAGSCLGGYIPQLE